MDDMEDLLVTTIESLGYPVFRIGSLAEDEAYPESFFTFWNNGSYDDSFYDNKEHCTIWDFDLSFYSSNPNLVQKELMRAKETLKANNFIVNGKGYDVKSDEITHTGRGINVKIIENY